MRIKERKAAGTGWGVPSIVMMMFSDKCPRLRTISVKTASRVFIVLH